MINIKADKTGLIQLAELNLLFKKDNKPYLKIDDLMIPITTSFKFTDKDLETDNTILEEITSIEFITKFKNLWKDGEKQYKCGSKNMGSVNILKEKFRKFNAEYPQYNGDAIITATKKMINYYKHNENGNDFTYIKRPPGFVWGDKINTVVDGFKTNKSKMLIDYLLEVDEIDTVEFTDEYIQERFNIT